MGAGGRKKGATSYHRAGVGTKGDIVPSSKDKAIVADAEMG